MEINKIHHEDCLIGMAKLKNESIDCIITDPPFNSETKMANPFRPDSKAKMSEEEWFIYNNMSARGYNFWFNNVIKEIYRVCKTGSHIYIFTNWRSLRNTMDLMEQNFIVLHDVLTWDKEHFGVGFKYRPQTEFIIFGSKGKPKDVNSHSNSNLFRLKRVSKPYSLVQKPVELIDKMVLMSSNEGDLILDPFMCSGTTALSAQKNNRNFIGFEINKENYAESQRRLNVGGLFSNSFQTELSNEAGT